jgi:hypothetical protein
LQHGEQYGVAGQRFERPDDHCDGFSGNGICIGMQRDPSQYFFGRHFWVDIFGRYGGAASTRVISRRSEAPARPVLRSPKIAAARAREPRKVAQASKLCGSSLNKPLLEQHRAGFAAVAAAAPRAWLE